MFHLNDEHGLDGNSTSQVQGGHEYVFLKAVCMEYMPVVLARDTVFFSFLITPLPMHKTKAGIFSVV